MKPLEGIRIVDFTQAHAGSLATMILADFGAEVIKIERAGIGDLARYWAPMRDGDSGYYAYLNRGKKSIAVNATHPQGLEVVKRLISRADVVTENFKFGSMDRMGLSYEEVKKICPDIIYASLNGFGQTGPMRQAIGLDLQLQAMSGIMDQTGFANGLPTKAGAALADQLSGTYMTIAILMALVHRKKTGEGQRVDISILDSLVSVLEAAPVSLTLNGYAPQRQGNGSAWFAPCDTFQVSDGEVALSVKTEEQWHSLCRALSLEALETDDRFSSNELRCEHKEELYAALSKELRTEKKREVELWLQQAGVPCGAVRSVREAMELEPIRRRMLRNIQDAKLGNLTVPGSAIRLEQTPGNPEHGAPGLGEHTDQYLKELGYTDEIIKQLYEERILEHA